MSSRSGPLARAAIFVEPSSDTTPVVVALAACLVNDTAAIPTLPIGDALPNAACMALSSRAMQAAFGRASPIGKVGIAAVSFTKHAAKATTTGVVSLLGSTKIAALAKGPLRELIALGARAIAAVRSAGAAIHTFYSGWQDAEIIRVRPVQNVLTITPVVTKMQPLPETTAERVAAAVKVTVPPHSRNMVVPPDLTKTETSTLKNRLRKDYQA